MATAVVDRLDEDRPAEPPSDDIDDGIGSAKSNQSVAGEFELWKAERFDVPDHLADTRTITFASAIWAASAIVVLPMFVCSFQLTLCKSSFVYVGVFPRIKHTKVIEAQPDALHFGGFQLKQEYVLKLKLVNISDKVQRIHILPPQTKFFSVHYRKRVSSHLSATIHRLVLTVD